MSLQLLFFHVRVFDDVSRLVERGKQALPWKTTRQSLCSAAIYRAGCSHAGMVLHLDLLNYEEAVDRLYDCLLLLFLTLALLNTVVQLSMYAPIPWLQPARLDKCSLQARITVTSGHCHSSCALKHHLNDTKLTGQQQVSIKSCIGAVFC